MDLTTLYPEGLSELKEDWEIELEEDLWEKSYERGEIELTQANKEKYNDLQERTIR